MIIRLLKHLQLLLRVVFWWFALANSYAFAQNWQSTFYLDHALVGKIWDTQKNAWLTKKQLNLELLEYDYILLGETHNNYDHHILQSSVIDSLVAADVQPTIVMEMLAQKNWQGQPTVWTNLEALKKQAILRNDGWPWELYIPVLKSVVENRLELIAGNIDSKSLHKWSNKMGSNVDEDIVREYSISSQGYRQLKRDIVESHCGYANTGFVQFMARAQLQRDYVITNTLINSKLPVVLIAGAGHVRNNYAIPMQLLHKYHQLAYISIAFVPVQPGWNDPNDYLDESPAEFDILYFTPSHTNEDPCLVFRKQLQNLGRKNTSQH